MSENTPPAAAAPPPHEGRQTDPDSGALHEELFALEALDAARKIVDDEAAQDRAAGPPLPDDEFDPAQAVGAATDSAMRDAYVNIADDAFRDASRMADEVMRRKGGALDQYRQGAAAARRERFKAGGTPLGRGMIGRGGFAARRARFQGFGRNPVTPNQPPEGKAPEAPDQTDSGE